MVLTKMNYTKHTNKSDKALTHLHLSILIGITLVIGLYLIVTATMVSKDGIYYIERAQHLQTDPATAIKGRYFGFPLLICATHKLFTMMFDGPEFKMWLYSAQSITLACRIMALIPLYYIGKLLVGIRKSFWALLILVLLPYPARFGSDILREWPYILLLSTGFLFLLKGAKEKRPWMFGVAGLAAGIGMLIRPECAQLVIYGILWLVIAFIVPQDNMGRIKVALSLMALLIGFSIIAAPYATQVKTRILSTKFQLLFSDSSKVEPDNLPELNISNSDNSLKASIAPLRVVKAVARLFEELSDNLYYFFLPPMIIGLLHRFRKRDLIKKPEKFFEVAFIGLNMLLMILLYYNGGYISRRHCLPLVLLLIFYVPTGLEIMSGWWANKFSKNPESIERDSMRLCLVLIGIGILCCLPRLLTPMRIDKRSYINAANWLKENTSTDDRIAVPDRRLYFYAERKGMQYGDIDSIPMADYVVTITKGEKKKPKYQQEIVEQYEVLLNKRKQKILVVYKVLDK